MRWMWIDRVVELVARTRIVTIKNVSLAEEHLHDHFAGSPGRPAWPVVPASLVLEGMAQSAGILVGHAGGFREKVVLAKVGNATFVGDATPGQTLRFTATIEKLDAGGASVVGTVEALDHGRPASGYQPLAAIDLMFSHLDNNLAGVSFPAHNFVFGETFRTLLRQSGIPCDF